MPIYRKSLLIREFGTIDFAERFQVQGQIVESARITGIKLNRPRKVLHGISRTFDAVVDGSDFELQLGIFRIQAASLSEHIEPLGCLALHNENLPAHCKRDRN